VWVWVWVCAKLGQPLLFLAEEIFLVIRTCVCLPSRILPARRVLIFVTTINQICRISTKFSNLVQILIFCVGITVPIPPMTDRNQASFKQKRSIIWNPVQPHLTPTASAQLVWRIGNQNQSIIGTTFSGVVCFTDCASVLKPGNYSCRLSHLQCHFQKPEAQARSWSS